MNNTIEEQIRKIDALKIENMAKDLDLRLEDDEVDEDYEADLARRRITARESDKPFMWACNCDQEPSRNCKCPACDGGFLVRN